MGLLDNQTMPSLHDIAHDRFMRTFIMAAGQLLSGLPVWYGKGSYGDGYMSSLHVVFELSLPNQMLK